MRAGYFPRTIERINFPSIHGRALPALWAKAIRPHVPGALDGGTKHGGPQLGIRFFKPNLGCRETGLSLGLGCGILR